MISIVFLSSCYYDVEEQLYPNGGCQTANMSLQANVLPILVRSCYACHDAVTNNGNVTIEGYAELSKYITNGKLMGSIRQANGFIAMPQGAPKLSDCEISKIEQWIVQGALNN
jgi:cytochrome c553